MKHFTLLLCYFLYFLFQTPLVLATPQEQEIYRFDTPLAAVATTVAFGGRLVYGG